MSRFNITRSLFETNPTEEISFDFFGFPNSFMKIDMSCDKRLRKISSSNVPNLFHWKYRNWIVSFLEIWINFLKISLNRKTWPTKRSRLFCFAILISSLASRISVHNGFSTKTCFLARSAFFIKEKCDFIGVEIIIALILSSLKIFFWFETYSIDG